MIMGEWLVRTEEKGYPARRTREGGLAGGDALFSDAPAQCDNHYKSPHSGHLTHLLESLPSRTLFADR